ncbi:HNH endonuclease family protein [Streptomyces sp. NPDC016845]|uniref:HNH endonuclease family protein n=1 Tax=Streptomyces sp. NPDC016845 TaxID=3364972 RepID=UPI0037B5691E
MTNHLHPWTPALAAFALLAPAPSFAAAGPPTAPAAHAPARTSSPADPVHLPLLAAVERLSVAPEHRDGYQRGLYKHWNRGLDPHDGCNTRKEVIIAEAAEAPHITAGCKLTGGTWHSAYDHATVHDAARLDVDHFVPLAEVHDSEQTPWSPARREAYANDQTSPDTLIAVTAASNRSKADKDPAQWMPTDHSYHCTYTATWVATKLRWDLAADPAEADALHKLATHCPTTTVHYPPAP